MLCGQKEDLNGAMLWEQDVIVVTAGNSIAVHAKIQVLKETVEITQMI